MTSNVKLLPLPRYFDRNVSNMTWEGLTQAAIDHAHACVAHATAAKDAEIEALRNQRDFLVAEYERAVDCGEQGYTHAAMHLFNAIANAQADANAKTIEVLRAENKGHGIAIQQLCDRAKWLDEALRDAREAVEDWAQYASPYFQEKHDLQGDLAKIDAVLDQEVGNG